MTEDLADKKRAELDRLAREAGVPDPEKLPNKAAVLETIAPNPALVPDPVERTEQTYEVVGPRIVHGAKPGQTFTTLLDEQLEAALIYAGHIKPTTAKDTTG